VCHCIRPINFELGINISDTDNWHSGSSHHYVGKSHGHMPTFKVAEENKSSVMPGMGDRG